MRLVRRSRGRGCDRDRVSCLSLPSVQVIDALCHAGDDARRKQCLSPSSTGLRGRGGGLKPQRPQTYDEGIRSHQVGREAEPVPKGSSSTVR